MDIFHTADNGPSTKNGVFVYAIKSVTLDSNWYLVVKSVLKFGNENSWKCAQVPLFTPTN